MLTQMPIRLPIHWRSQMRSLTPSRCSLLIRWPIPMLIQRQIQKRFPTLIR